MPTLVAFTLSRIVAASPQQTFALLSGLAEYPTWLPGSDSFEGLRDISDDPIQVGTTYRDHGSAMTMDGRITKCDPGRALTFVQGGSPAKGVFRPRIEIEIAYTMSRRDDGCELVRDYALRGSWLLMPAKRVLYRTTHGENVRVMDCIASAVSARAGE